MDYFTTSDINHNLKFIHRVFSPLVTIELYHELTNTKNILENVVCELSSGYSSVSFDFDFILNGTYTIEISSDKELIYRSKAKAI